MDDEFVIWLDKIGRADVPLVGGKNASLGEMIQNLSDEGVNVPPGFATTSNAYWQFLEANDLGRQIQARIDNLESSRASLAETGDAIRRSVLSAEWPDEIARPIKEAYRELGAQSGAPNTDVAVRSSATAEDLPDASFAGQQETFLNITGERQLLDACRRCYASLFTDRAISYRIANGFDHMKVALSVGVQKMVRSDTGGAGVMFSIDTESGFDGVVLINAAWGLGESVVQGTVDPDEYEVFKPLLDDPAHSPIIERKLGQKARKLIYATEGEAPTRDVPTSRAERAAFVLDDREILQLARWATAIEAHYGMPMDMEWAKDGKTGDLSVVQARPETVQSRKQVGILKSYELKSRGKKLVSGLSIGDAIVSGKVCLLRSADEIDRFVSGSVLVTEITDPDWVPIMKRAAAIITDHGGRTSHAAIVSREMGLPAIVGTGNATHVLHDEQEVTVSCAEGDEGFVYEGIGDYTVTDISLDEISQTRTQVMLNMANPAAALRWWMLPSDGVGLARMEFIINNAIKIHPMALVRFDTLKDGEARELIGHLTQDIEDKTEYFVERLARGIAKIAAAQYPKPVIVRTSDFKTNEYANLVGGREFEPHEENPMVGFRGASRYYSPRYREGFALECRALRRVRDEMGFENVIVMIPFCRSVREADLVLDVLSENGLKRGENGLKVYVMCEIPSNVILAKQFAERFDGFSIGSNDLTQLVLGVDRDSDALSDLFDERDEAVKSMIRDVIDAAHRAGAKVGLCGQAPSDHPDFAEFLVEAGIDSMSVTPDSFIEVKSRIRDAEARLHR